MHIGAAGSEFWWNENAWKREGKEFKNAVFLRDSEPMARFDVSFGGGVVRIVNNRTGKQKETRVPLRKPNEALVVALLRFLES